MGPRDKRIRDRLKQMKKDAYSIKIERNVELTDEQKLKMRVEKDYNAFIAEPHRYKLGRKYATTYRP